MNPLYLTMACCVLALASCNNDQESGKSAIDRHNEKMAQDAVHMMKTPLDQAKAAAGLENAHNKKMEDQLKTQ